LGVKEKDVTKYALLGYPIVQGIMNHTRVRKEVLCNSLAFFLIKVYNYPNFNWRVK